jgi:hypothetical protein
MMSSICNLKTGFMVNSPRCIDCRHNDLDVLASITLRKLACMKRHRTRATHASAQLRRAFPVDLMFVNPQRCFEAHLARLTSSHTMDEYTQARCQAAENAALLVCLREQPSVPHENKQPAYDTHDGLTLRREVQLIEDFAFISSMKDDPNGVTAVCMEIDRDGSGVTFRVAANNGHLSHITQELQKITNLMVRASRHGMSEMPDTEASS